MCCICYVLPYFTLIYAIVYVLLIDLLKMYLNDLLIYAIFDDLCYIRICTFDICYIWHGLM